MEEENKEEVPFEEEDDEDSEVIESEGGQSSKGEDFLKSVITA